MKVKEMSNNAYVITNFETGETVLQSYNSTVAKIYKPSYVFGKDDFYLITLGKHWNYSVTTLKHVYNFLLEYAPKELNLLNSRTKKRSIENLIKLGIIQYDENMI